MAAKKRLMVTQKPAPRGPGAESVALVRARLGEVERAVRDVVIPDPTLGEVAVALTGSARSIRACLDLLVESTEKFASDEARARSEGAPMAAQAAEQLTSAQRFATPQDRVRARDAAAAALAGRAVASVAARVIAEFKDRAAPLAQAAAEKLLAVEPAIRRAELRRELPAALSEKEERNARRLERQLRARPVRDRLQHALRLMVSALELDDLPLARVIAEAGQGIAVELADQSTAMLRLKHHSSAMRAGDATAELRAARDFVAACHALRERDHAGDALQVAVRCAKQLEACFQRVVGIDPADKETVSSAEFGARYLSRSPRPFKVDDVLGGESGADWLLRYAHRREVVTLPPFRLEAGSAAE